MMQCLWQQQISLAINWQIYISPVLWSKELQLLYRRECFSENKIESIWSFIHSEWGIFQRSYREKLCHDYRHFKLKINVCLFVMALESFIVIKLSEENVEQENTTTTSSTLANFSFQLSIITLRKKLFHLLVCPTETGQFYQIKEWQTARNIIFLKRDN